MTGRDRFIFTSDNIKLSEVKINLSLKQPGLSRNAFTPLICSFWYCITENWLRIYFLYLDTTNTTTNSIFYNDSKLNNHLYLSADHLIWSLIDLNPGNVHAGHERISRCISVLHNPSVFLFFIFRNSFSIFKYLLNMICDSI